MSKPNSLLSPGGQHAGGIAAALEYAVAEEPPLLVAKGRRELADRLLKIAEEHNISVIRQPDLASRLVEMDIGDHIPTDLYIIVAEILAAIIAAKR